MTGDPTVRAAFKVAVPHLAGLLGRKSSLAFVPDGPVSRNTRTPDSLVLPVEVRKVKYRLEVTRSRIPITSLERHLAREFLSAFKILMDGFDDPAHDQHFQTALLSSLGDISLARYLRKDRSEAFSPVQQLLRVLRLLSYEKHEGEPATIGFLVYRKGLAALRKAIGSSGDTWLSFPRHARIDDQLIGNPLVYRYVDGLQALYGVNIKMDVTGTIRLDPTSTQEAVDRLSLRGVARILPWAGVHAFAAVVNKSSDIEVMDGPDSMLVWRKGVWSIFDLQVFRSFLSGKLDPAFIDGLAWAVYSLSKMRHGTVVLICDTPKWKASSARVGSVGSNCDVATMLIGHAVTKDIGTLGRDGDLLRFLSSDGLTVFDSAGKLVDTGVIVKTSLGKQDVPAGGGRTVAASSASSLGPVIKVSEDGPIDLFEGGVSVYRFG